MSVSKGRNISLYSTDPDQYHELIEEIKSLQYQLFKEAPTKSKIATDALKFYRDFLNGKKDSSISTTKFIDNWARVSS